MLVTNSDKSLCCFSDVFVSCINCSFASLHFMFTFYPLIGKWYVGTLVSQPEKYRYSIVRGLPTA